MTNLALPFLLIALAASAPAAPVPDEARAPLLYATKVGTKWVYDNGGEEVTEVVTAADTKAGVTTLTVDTHWATEKVWSARLAVSAEGVVSVGLNDEVFDHPVWLVKANARPGDRWDDRNDGIPQFRSTTYAGRVEEVRVPTGRYRAVRVDTTTVGRPEPRTPRTTATFFAPGVGVVKVDVRTEDGTWVPSRVLKSFTPGKD